jgi:hypothetical protein
MDHAVVLAFITKWHFVNFSGRSNLRYPLEISIGVHRSIHTNGKEIRGTKIISKHGLTVPKMI